MSATSELSKHALPPLTLPQALARVAELENPWVPVSDRLPGAGTIVFARENDEYFSATCDSRGWWAMSEVDGRSYAVEPTQWMPIPPLPQSRQNAYIEVSAGVRYWEDAIVNGVPDESGDLIPLRDGQHWKPVIRLVDGAIMGWPQGIEADIHYKVCDQGEYWLQDESRHRVAKLVSDYVPDNFLCHGGVGHGDYIVFKVSADGVIDGWRAPAVDMDLWRATQEPQG